MSNGALMQSPTMYSNVQPYRVVTSPGPMVEPQQFYQQPMYQSQQYGQNFNRNMQPMNPQSSLIGNHQGVMPTSVSMQFPMN